MRALRAERYGRDDGSVPERAAGWRMSDLWIAAPLRGSGRRLSPHLQTFAPTVSQAMETIDQLRHYLRNAGYSQFLTCDEATRVAVYDLRLKKSGSDWRVFETEQGQEISAYAKTSDEGEASRAFLQIVSTRIYHFKTCNDTESIAKFETMLEAADIPFQRNDVPYEGKLRVFVTGTNLLKAQQVAALSSA